MGTRDDGDRAGVDDPTIAIEIEPGGSPGVVAVLIGLEGELAGELYPIRDGENRVGRAEECEVRLDSPFVSRLHAQLTHFEGAFALSWLSDKNPPKVNGEPVGEGEVYVRDGDLLALGRTVFSFRTATRAAR